MICKPCTNQQHHNCTSPQGCYCQHNPDGRTIYDINPRVKPTTEPTTEPKEVTNGGE